MNFFNYFGGIKYNIDQNYYDKNIGYDGAKYNLGMAGRFLQILGPDKPLNHFKLVQFDFLNLQLVNNTG